MASQTKKIIHIDDDEPKKVDPPKPVPPKVEPPKPVPAKVDPPKPVPPKVIPSKPAPPKPVPAKVDPPKPVPPPKVVPPKVEPPKPIPPVAPIPVKIKEVDPPKPAAPKIEPPKIAPSTSNQVANLNDLIDNDEVVENKDVKPKKDVTQDKTAQNILIQKLTNQKEDADSEKDFNNKVRTLLKDRGSNGASAVIAKPKETVVPVKDIGRILLRLEKIQSRNNSVVSVARSKDRRPPTGRANNKVSTGRSEV